MSKKLVNKIYFGNLLLSHYIVQYHSFLKFQYNFVQGIYCKKKLTTPLTQLEINYSTTTLINGKSEIVKKYLVIKMTILVKRN